MVRTWWEGTHVPEGTMPAIYPDSNIGVACGELSDLTVVDVDDPETFWAWVADNGGSFLSMDIINTPSGGQHLYFTYCDKVRNSVCKIPGADVRTEGGYVVAAGSEGYTQQDDGYQGAAIPLPLFIEESLVEAEKKPREPRVEGGGDIPDGQRHNFLVEAAGRMQRLDVLTVAALQEINLDRCNPPAPIRHVEGIVGRMQKYAPEFELTAEGTPPLYIKASDYAESMIESLADKSAMAGAPTCFKGLNYHLGGGFRKGEFWAIHAPGKRGKSSVLHQLIQGYLKDGVPIGYASREMSPDSEVLPNMMSIEFNENAWGAEMTDERMARYGATLSEWPLFFTPGYGTFTDDQFKPWITQLKDLGVDFFFIDHFHYCLEDEGDNKEIARLAKTLKTLTKELDVGIISIIQPRQMLEGTELSQATLRGGAAIGQALDGLITLERHIDPNTNTAIPNLTELIVKDVRHKLGKKGKIFLEYNSETTVIKEVEVKYEAPKEKGPTALESVL